MNTKASRRPTASRYATASGGGLVSEPAAGRLGAPGRILGLLTMIASRAGPRRTPGEGARVPRRDPPRSTAEGAGPGGGPGPPGWLSGADAHRDGAQRPDGGQRDQPPRNRDGHLPGAGSPGAARPWPRQRPRPARGRCARPNGSAGSNWAGSGWAGPPGAGSSWAEPPGRAIGSHLVADEQSGPSSAVCVSSAPRSPGGRRGGRRPAARVSPPRPRHRAGGRGKCPQRRLVRGSQEGPRHRRQRRRPRRSAARGRPAPARPARMLPRQRPCSRGPRGSAAR